MMHVVVLGGDYIYVNQVLEYFIDESLENSRSIGQFVWHNLVFVVPPCGVEGCFPFIPIFDLHQVISTV